MKYGLSNVYLEWLLLPRCKTFGGVYPCDDIPLFKSSEKFSVIINLSKRNERGTHFVAISYANEQLSYFDSFGMPCYNNHIRNYMSSYATSYVYNNMTVQSVDSFFCGYYCACFCLAHDARVPLSRFVKHFSRDCKRNEKVVEHLIKEYIS